MGGEEKLRFTISIIKHNGKKAILLRSIITDRDMISRITKEAILDGCYHFNACARFRNPAFAIQRLNAEGLIEFSLHDLLREKLRLFQE